MKESHYICYTIGHSTHSVADFTMLLRTHDIQYVIDVRSCPYSKHVPQFNRETLKKDLEHAGLKYVYMGDTLSAQQNDASLFFDNMAMVDFEKVSRTPVFQQGIRRVIEGLKKGYKIALMCAEKDPFNCHRFVLVSHCLSKEGVQVRHIREDGRLESNEALETRLLQKYMKQYRQATLFGESLTKEQAIEKSYVERNKDFAKLGSWGVQSNIARSEQGQ